MVDRARTSFPDAFLLRMDEEVLSRWEDVSGSSRMANIEFELDHVKV